MRNLDEQKTHDAPGSCVSDFGDVDAPTSADHLYRDALPRAEPHRIPTNGGYHEILGEKMPEGVS